MTTILATMIMKKVKKVNDKVGICGKMCLKTNLLESMRCKYIYIVLSTCTLGDMYFLVVLKEILRRSLDVNTWVDVFT